MEQERKKGIKRILISQPEPKSDKSPYFDLERKYNVKVDFKPFISVEPLPYKEFRKQKVDILAHTAVIFTSRNAVDHFFSIVKDAKIEMPADFKYFCISEQTANYLQKYITVRKRKLFVGQRTAQDLLNVLKKHKKERILFPCSSIRKGDIPNFLTDNGYEWTEAVIYHTVAADLSSLEKVDYDLIAFFSPSGINSLL